MQYSLTFEPTDALATVRRTKQVTNDTEATAAGARIDELWALTEQRWREREHCSGAPTLSWIPAS